MVAAAQGGDVRRHRLGHLGHAQPEFREALLRGAHANRRLEVGDEVLGVWFRWGMNGMITTVTSGPGDDTHSLMRDASPVAAPCAIARRVSRGKFSAPRLKASACSGHFCFDDCFLLPWTPSRCIGGSTTVTDESRGGAVMSGLEPGCVKVQDVPALRPYSGRGSSFTTKRAPHQSSIAWPMTNSFAHSMASRSSSQERAL